MSLDSPAGLWQVGLMDADERDIFQFLKSWGADFIAAREICRRAGGKRRFTEEPDWAKPILLRMVERGIIESNSTGHFRIKRVSKKHRDKQQPSQSIAEILKESGVEVENAGGQSADEESDLGPDEYYDQL